MAPLVVQLGMALVGGGAAAQGAPPAAVRELSGVVYHDENDNGRRDPGERGIAGVAVSDQELVAVTDSAGRYRLRSALPTGLLFVSVPDGFLSRGDFWAAPGDSGRAVDFALRRLARRAALTVLHASDTHIAPASLPRMDRLRALIDSLRPDLVLVTGDLVRDALRVGEGEARGYYELFAREVGKVRVPLFTVPGNHEVFGIERDKSGVRADHPLYARAMYRHYRGPDYYSFTAGGVHFVALNTVDIDDTRYYGHLDSLQLAWLARDVAAVPARTPVVTFNHIPFFTAVETINGLQESPPAPSVITVSGKAAFRHAVSNAREAIQRIAPHPYPLALAGHMHTRESLRYAGVATRFEQGAAVVGPSGNTTLAFPSGVTLYTVRLGTIGEGRFVPLDARRATP